MTLSNSSSNRVPVYDESGRLGYQMMFQNGRFVEYKAPPSYLESLKLHSCPSQSARHLPPNQPKLLSHARQHPDTTLQY
ncbi:unnamed protein product [Caenorhabditis auriculariae]|uniref:Uncharacterized protein n=1 Tax=Caenorhabditis auriculariae TaxID=2777116 RepID=A0A8S1H5B0_9PELO|nr:unnamed protein product [Caenorhabditis auriculariae]